MNESTTEPSNGFRIIVVEQNTRDQQVVQAVQKDGLQLPYMRGWLGMGPMQYQTYFRKFWKPFKNALLAE
jgi:hypothetical protein